jgi:uncharacterized protein (DUF1800 family)
VKPIAMPINSLRELKPQDFDYWKANHLASRAGFGGTPSQVRALHQLGLDGAVDYIVDYEKLQYAPVKDNQYASDIMRPPTEEERLMIAEARRTNNEAIRERLQQERQRRQAADREQMRDVQKWWLKRIIETTRPLEEKMTLFWHGHFATGYRAIEDSYHMFLQNHFFRANATGNFADLVFGIIRDPAMLEYLNNNQNRRQSPNENLARELMELFTLGEGNVYSERDIKEGARALTGYTFEDDEFTFRRDMHDTDEKTIFGQKGKWDGVDFCRMILSQRVCSEYICWKLYRYFVNDLPGTPDKNTQGFIVRLARVMRDNNYALKPVLKTLFRSEHFYDHANRASVIKNPVQLIVQAIRSMRTPVRNLGALVNAADLMGQNLFYPPNVKGWDGGRAWINTSTMFVRQNLMIYLLTGRRPEGYEWDADGSAFDALHLIEEIPASADEPTLRRDVVHLLRFNLGTQPHPDRIDTLVTYVNENGGALNNDTLIALLSLIAAMPEFQLC